MHAMSVQKDMYDKKMFRFLNIFCHHRRYLYFNVHSFHILVNM